MKSGGNDYAQPQPTFSGGPSRPMPSLFHRAGTCMHNSAATFQIVGKIG